MNANPLLCRNRIKINVKWSSVCVCVCMCICTKYYWLTLKDAMLHRNENFELF